MSRSPCAGQPANYRAAIVALYASRAVICEKDGIPGVGVAVRLSYRIHIGAWASLCTQTNYAQVFASVASALNTDPASSRVRSQRITDSTNSLMHSLSMHRSGELLAEVISGEWPRHLIFAQS